MKYKNALRLAFKIVFWTTLLWAWPTFYPEGLSARFGPSLCIVDGLLELYYASVKGYL